MSLKELADSLTKVRKTLAEIERAMYARERELAQAAQRSLEKEFGPRLAATKEALVIAEQAFTLERERIALTGEKAPLPIGTVLVRWKLAPIVKSTRVKWVTDGHGIVEPVTTGSKFPSGRHVPPPEIGTFIIRIIRKDMRTPTKYWASFGRFGKGLEYDPNALPRGWHPVGVDPNKLP